MLEHFLGYALIAFVLFGCFLLTYRIAFSDGVQSVSNAFDHNSSVILTTGEKQFHAPCGCRMALCAEHVHCGGPGAWQEVRDIHEMARQEMRAGMGE